MYPNIQATPQHLSAPTQSDLQRSLEKHKQRLRLEMLTRLQVIPLHLLPPQAENTETENRAKRKAR